jgi:hypothetical protein
MVQTTNVAGTDLDRGFSHLSQVLRAGTRRTAGPPTQPTQRSRRSSSGDPQTRPNCMTCFVHVPSHTLRLRVQVSAAASREARDA